MSTNTAIPVVSSTSTTSIGGKASTSIPIAALTYKATLKLQISASPAPSFAQIRQAIMDGCAANGIAVSSVSVKGE